MMIGTRGKYDAIRNVSTGVDKPHDKNALVSCIPSIPFHSFPFINHKCMQAFQGSESVRPVSSTNLGVPILYKNASRINDHPQTL
jgi:hypothetical protein